MISKCATSSCRAAGVVKVYDVHGNPYYLCLICAAILKKLNEQFTKIEQGLRSK